jgi:hypothetical protein
MVLTLMLPLRAIFGLQDLITQYHIDCMCKICLATGSMVGYAYGMEFFIAWYGANPYEGFAFVNRAFGPYAWAYWIMISCNVITPQFFWFRWARENLWLVWILSCFINVGMWFERFVITVTSLANDFLPQTGITSAHDCRYLHLLRDLRSLWGTLLTLYPLPAACWRSPKSRRSQSRRMFMVTTKGRRTSHEKTIRIFWPSSITPRLSTRRPDRYAKRDITRWDVITPFPVHGLDGAMGLKRSKVPVFTFMWRLHRFLHGDVHRLVHGRLRLSADCRRQALLQSDLSFPGGLRADHSPGGLWDPGWHVYHQPAAYALSSGDELREIPPPDRRQVCRGHRIRGLPFLRKPRPGPFSSS